MAVDARTRLTRTSETPPGKPAPQIVALPELLADRQEEACRLLASLETVPKAQPRHLRRRGRSFWPFRLPRHRQPGATAVSGTLRRKKVRLVPKSVAAGAVPGAPTVVQSRSGDGVQEVEAVAEDSSSNQTYVRVRKHLRRPGLLLAERAWSVECADRPRWLETHIWHAKRAAMEDVWGFRLAARNSFLGQRALSRSAMRHCCMHDRSYLAILELVGTEEGITQALELCGIKKELTLADPVRLGARRGRALLRDCNLADATALRGHVVHEDAESTLICPVLLVWQSGCADAAEDTSDSEIIEASALPFGDDTNVGQHASQAASVRPARTCGATPKLLRRLWIWVHPSAVQSAKTALERALETVLIRDAQLRLRQLVGSVFFELTGPRSLEVLARALPPSACSEGMGLDIWREISSSVAGVRVAPPPGSMLTLNVDTQAIDACATAALAPAQTDAATSLTSRPWLSRWPPAAAANGLFASATGATVLEAPAGNPSVKNIDNRVPVLLIFRGGSLPGVDVLVPPRSCGAKLWLRCTFASARFLGFRDRHSLHWAAGVPEFPFDFPEAAAGKAEAASSAASLLELHRRRPPAKRPNFRALGVPCPHSLDWSFCSDQLGTVGGLAEGSEATHPWLPKVLRPAALGSRAAALARRATTSDNPSPSPTLLPPPHLLLAVVVRSAGRGVPRTRCHLFWPRPGDLPEAFAETSFDEDQNIRPGRQGKGVNRSAAAKAPVADPEEPPRWRELLDISVRLQEPLHKRFKNKRLRMVENVARRAAAASPEAPSSLSKPCKEEGGTTLRELVGFVTSGGCSGKFGSGVGVGAVSASAFAQILAERQGPVVEQTTSYREGSGGCSLTGRWCVLWARTTTSLVYFPVWVRAIRRDEGFG